MTSDTNANTRGRPDERELLDEVARHEGGIDALSLVQIFSQKGYLPYNTQRTMQRALDKGSIGPRPKAGCVLFARLPSHQLRCGVKQTAFSGVTVRSRRIRGTGSSGGPETVSSIRKRPPTFRRYSDRTRGQVRCLSYTPATHHQSCPGRASAGGKLRVKNRQSSRSNLGFIRK